MTGDQTAAKRMQDYVTVGGAFSLAGVVEASDNQMFKMGTFYGADEKFSDDESSGVRAGTFALLSDEGETLRGQGMAPLPLQYFLAGIAF